MFIQYKLPFAERKSMRLVRSTYTIPNTRVAFFPCLTLGIAFFTCLARMQCLQVMCVDDRSTHIPSTTFFQAISLMVWKFVWPRWRCQVLRSDACSDTWACSDMWACSTKLGTEFKEYRQHEVRVPGATRVPLCFVIQHEVLSKWAVKEESRQSALIDSKRTVADGMYRDVSSLMWMPLAMSRWIDPMLNAGIDEPP